MPQASNFDVQDSSGHTVTWKLLNPASGSEAARWVTTNDAKTRAGYGKLSVFAKRNGKKTADQVQLDLTIPAFVEKQGVETVVGQALVKLFIAIPDNMPEVKRDDVAAVIATTLGSETLKSVLRTGSSPY